MCEDESYEGKADIKEEIRVVSPETYAEDGLLYVEQKMKLFELSENIQILNAMNSVKKHFQEIGRDCNFHKIMDEVNVIYDYFTQIRITRDDERIYNELQEKGLSLLHLSVSEKAKLFTFQLDNNNYNLMIHTTVLKNLEINMNFDERYDNYQKKYWEILKI